MAKRLIVGITGADGRHLRHRAAACAEGPRRVESHLVLTDAACSTSGTKHKMKRKDVERLAHVAYHPKESRRASASGSFITRAW